MSETQPIARGASYDGKTAGLLTYPGYIAPSQPESQWQVATNFCFTATARIAWEAGITAAGTVGDSHPVPY